MEQSEEGQGALRRTLVRTAMAMLEANMPDLSLRAVARAAGVSAMAPYRHFPNKAGLQGAVASEGFAILTADLLAAGAGAGPRDHLVFQGLAYIRFAQTRPALFRLMFADRRTVELGEECEAQAYRVLIESVEAIVDTGVEQATLASWAIVHGLAMLALDGRLDEAAESNMANVLQLFALSLGQSASSVAHEAHPA
ncbi:TetR/AcrR family transcriptional regulator [Sphingobium sp. EM0848]|uniref:TetR/AcrR family transcriptional regulator n=1 Tax=Sphingobium sp. EM0848 TaxID=2743473 RepID=UPI00159C3D86|nr:TetR/AcrR family transcriptional regulator [Sphingobium sp. EM0848]